MSKPNRNRKRKRRVNSLRVVYVETCSDSDESRSLFARNLRESLIRLDHKDFILCVICHNDLNDDEMDNMLAILGPSCQSRNICLMGTPVDSNEQDWQLKIQDIMTLSVNDKYEKEYGKIQLEHFWHSSNYIDIVKPYARHETKKKIIDKSIENNNTKFLVEKCSKRTPAGRKKVGENLLNKIIQNDLSEITLVVAFTYNVNDKEVDDVFNVLRGAADLRYIGLVSVSINPKRQGTQQALRELSDRFQKRLDNKEVEMVELNL